MSFCLDKAQNFLRHDHTWVQLGSSQLFGLLFSNYSVDDLMSSSYLTHSNVPIFLKVKIENFLSLNIFFYLRNFLLRLEN